MHDTACDNCACTYSTAFAGMASYVGRKLKSYAVKVKVVAVKWHQMNEENCSLTGRTFEVDRKRIREWE